MFQHLQKNSDLSLPKLDFFGWKARINSLKQWRARLEGKNAREKQGPRLDHLSVPRAEIRFKCKGKGVVEIN